VAATSSLQLIEVHAAAVLTGTEAASSQKRWGLLIDTAKCATGCDACVRGCHSEHGITSTGNDATDAQWIRKIDLADNLTGRESSLPMMCQHCDSAPCVDVCPTGASFKRADGVVLVNRHTCIGCRYCVMACPYKARSFIHETLTEQKALAPRGKGTVEGCTLCVHRIDAGYQEQTACADACTAEGHNAILFGDLNDPESALSKAIAEQGGAEVRSDFGLNTGVRYARL
jgi:molybdopterin-containing oxidoreductase family iron-sulfur binding subunit